MKEDQYLLNFTDQIEGEIADSDSRCELSESENLVINELKEGDQLTLDELSKRTSLGMPETMSALTLLELSRIVKKYPSGKYEVI